jgi:glycosyltransferase involved in cell wall biosynthesis
VKIAFIVQRYGADILGGSEYHCRLIAERMAQRHQVDVLTTCARDYITWKNEYPEGTDRIRGVNVRRFANARLRDIESFNRYSDWIFNYPHTDKDEMDWLEQQGPWCPALVEHLERHHRSYDVLIFFTYLYAPTLLGMRVNPARSILVPTAHDEPAIQLRLYQELFKSGKAFAYNTEVERRFLNSTFDIHAHAEETIGCGVDLPQARPYPKPADELAAAASGRDRQRGRGGERNGGERSRDVESAAPEHARDQDRDRDGDRTRDRETAREGDRALPRGAVEEEDGDSDDPDSGAGNRKVMRGRGEIFRRRHRLYGPMLLYGGRIDPGKGCEELFQHFNAYVQDGGHGTLVLMGAKLMPLPEDPSVRFAGLLSEQERVEALEAATVVVVPSPYESLSLLALESFAVGTPILANGRSEVLVEHVRKSNAGLYYGDQDEFVEGLKLLLADDRLRAGMGRNGRAYIKQNYRWDIVMGKYDRLITKLRG